MHNRRVLVYLLFGGLFAGIPAGAQTAVAPPGSLTASAVSDKQIDLAWIPGSTSRDGFIVERCQGTCTWYAKVATLPGNTTSYSSTGLTSGTTYWHRVRAYIGSTYSTYSNVAQATTLQSGTSSPPLTSGVPAAPTGLTAAPASTNAIYLNWTDNSDNEQQFVIERCQGTCTWYATVAAVPANTTRYTSAGLSPGVTYWHRVRAQGSAGYSAYSNVAQAATLLSGSSPVPPATPAGLTATAVSSSQINLTWTDTSTTEDGFLLERCSGAGCTSFAQIASLPAGSTTYINGSLAAGATYAYRVRSYTGSLNSGYSNTAQATLGASLTAPTGLTASALSASQVNLAWRNTSSSADGVLVERCAGSGCTGFARIAQLAATATTYSDTGLAASTTYSYRVRAFVGSVYSAYSNTAQAVTTASSTVVVTPGTDIQSLVNARASGTSFLIKAGVHRMQSITPKSGNEFIGEPGAILNGSRILNPVREGNYWVVYGQTQRGVRMGECVPEYPRCMYPEDLFFDHTPLRHVARLSDVGPGKWFFDYDAAKVYLGSDPAGHLVEIGVTRTAFRGSATGVKIRGLVVEKYASPAQIGAIGEQGPGAGWVIENNDVRLNHGVGIRAGHSSAILNNKVHHNGELGMGGVGDDILVQGNEISYNNTLGYNVIWEGGATKFAETRRLVIRNNHSHHNNGLGLWTDIDNIDVLMEGNTIENNNGGGISHEIGYAAVIRNNIVRNNIPGSCAWIWGGQIQIQNSQNVEVYGNTVVVPAGCSHGVTIVQQYRGMGKYGPYVSINNNIHNNSITYLGKSGGTGAASDYVTPDIFSLVSNNRFDYNNYHVMDLNHYYFVWSNSFRNWSSFRSYGQERNGTIDTNVVR